MSDVEERIKKLICEQLGVKEEEVTSEASFVEDLGADSLDTVELVMALEEEFETEIPDEEAGNIVTVGDACATIKKCKANKGKSKKITSAAALKSKQNCCALLRQRVLCCHSLAADPSTELSGPVSYTHLTLPTKRIV